MNDYEKVQKQLAKTIQKKIGVPINHKNISHDELSSEKHPGYLTMIGSTIRVGLGRGLNRKNIKIDPNFETYAKHLQALHKITGTDHPEVLHKAALVATGNERTTPDVAQDYRKLRDLQFKKQVAENPEISKYYKQQEGSRISKKIPPEQFKKYADFLKTKGIVGISYRHAGNFDQHIKDNKLDPSKILETPSHRGYIHEGKLYLTRKTPALPKTNGQVATLNAALEMFKPKGPPPLPKGPPPLPEKLPLPQKIAGPRQETIDKKLETQKALGKDPLAHFERFADRARKLIKEKKPHWDDVTVHHAILDLYRKKHHDRYKHFNQWAKKYSFDLAPTSQRASGPSIEKLKQNIAEIYRKEHKGKTIPPYFFGHNYDPLHLDI